MVDVIAAVETLYNDELKPYGRLLRKRLHELASRAGVSADVDSKTIRSFCQSCEWLNVQDEEGGEWVALLKGRSAIFVDFYSPIDMYPAELWRAVSSYFESLDDSNMVLPGGRYSCAQTLASRNLSFLSGFTLGQVCHIVQLSISQKKILGYLNGAVVPYGRSQSMLKERCAQRQRPCSNTVRGVGPLVDWCRMRTCLREILESMAPGASSIPLSNMKRLFRAKFHVELSETALGHSKLSELLQDPRLSDLCSVRLQGHGYVVVPVSLSPPSRRVENNLVGSVVDNVCRGKSLRARAKWITPLSLEDELAAKPSVAIRGMDEFGLADLGAGCPALESYGRESLPRLLGRCSNGTHKDQEDKRGGAKVGQGVGLCITAIDDNMSAEPSVFVKPRMPPASPTGPVLTPCTLGNLGFSVINGFIHGAIPPPTPVAGGAQRSCSLPRNMGSDRIV